MESIFEKSVRDIESAYDELGYSLGWRFLNCSKNVLDNDPDIALITLNPGGNSIQADHPNESCERGHSYLTERWGNALPGRSNLQLQLQAMFMKITQHSGRGEKMSDLMERSLSGYFIPFRSPRLSELERKKEAFQFGEQLWINILKTVRPKLFICIDRDTYNRTGKLIKLAYGLVPTDQNELATGWGKYTASLARYGASGEITLLRLPHLSTFKLFSSSNCRLYIDDIFEEACVGLNPDPQPKGLWA